MSDVSTFLEAKSDQLNAADIMGCNRVICIREVKVKKGDQPVIVYFNGDNNRPWKPCKGMLRILAAAWGVESKAWVGKSAELYFEASVKYAGKEVGGIRIKSLSDIDKRGIQCSLTLNRTQREPYHVAHLEVTKESYPEDKFEKAFQTMCKRMTEGTQSLQEIIGQCQQTGELTAEQLKRLEAAAPVEIDDEEENEVY